MQLRVISLQMNIIINNRIKVLGFADVIEINENIMVILRLS